MDKDRIIKIATKLAKKIVIALNAPRGWESVDKLEGDLLKEAKHKNIFRSGYGDIVEIFVKMDGDKLEDWIILTDDGGYYSVGAEYMIWTGGKYSLTTWSGQAASKMMKQYMRSGRMSRDPDYQA